MKIVKSFRIEQKLWDAAKSIAGERSLGFIIRGLLYFWVEDKLMLKDHVEPEEDPVEVNIDELARSLATQFEINTAPVIEELKLINAHMAFLQERIALLEKQRWLDDMQRKIHGGITISELEELKGLEISRGSKQE